MGGCDTESLQILFKISYVVCYVNYSSELSGTRTGLKWVTKQPLSKQELWKTFRSPKNYCLRPLQEESLALLETQYKEIRAGSRLLHSTINIHKEKEKWLESRAKDDKDTINELVNMKVNWGLFFPAKSKSSLTKDNNSIPELQPDICLNTFIKNFRNKISESGWMDGLPLERCLEVLITFFCWSKCWVSANQSSVQCLLLFAPAFTSQLQNKLRLSESEHMLWIVVSAGNLTVWVKISK